jgi:hypothetical protein
MESPERPSVYKCAYCCSCLRGLRTTGHELAWQRQTRGFQQSLRSSCDEPRPQSLAWNTGRGHQAVLCPMLLNLALPNCEEKARTRRQTEGIAMIASPTWTPPQKVVRPRRSRLPQRFPAWKWVTPHHSASGPGSIVLWIRTRSSVYAQP